MSDLLSLANHLLSTGRTLLAACADEPDQTGPVSRFRKGSKARSVALALSDGGWHDKVWLASDAGVTVSTVPRVVGVLEQSGFPIERRHCPLTGRVQYRLADEIGQVAA